MKLKLIILIIIFLMVGCMEKENMGNKVEEIRLKLIPGITQYEAAEILKEYDLDSYFLPKSKIDKILISEPIKEKFESYKGRLSAVIREDELFRSHGYQFIIEINNSDIVIAVIISEIRT